jgi:hypothetical protein
VVELEQKLLLPLWIKADDLDEGDELRDIYKEI